MTPFVLQDALVAKLKRLFHDSVYMNAQYEMVPLNIYAQNLPAKEEQDDRAHFPFITVRFGETVDQGHEVQSSCSVLLSVGIFDESLDMQGERTIQNITQRIRHAFMTYPILDRMFELDFPLTCSLFDDEDLSPYFFGYVNMKWKIPGVSREDVYFG
ncbi:hypothetical protein P5G60_03440 [Paenibacillus jamilae]|nr:hypothetical protein [Paenibacillus jamilae]